MITVIKATGQKEEFSEEKVKRSIERAGIPQDIRPQVLAHVKSKLRDNIPTSEIYHHILEFLAASPTPYARAKYSLKQAIMDLGPTGYPFEDFVSEILKTQGFKTLVRQHLHGGCISHEIDVVGQREHEKIMVEAKFHNNPGVHTDVHVAMYTKARFDDIKEKNNLTGAWLITNTKVTIDALAYGACVGMHVIGWSYPEKGSLRDLIEQAHLTPITALHTLPQNFREQLIANGTVLTKDLCDNPHKLDVLNLPHEKKQQVLAEIEYICK
jgi:hypothetical protein